MAADKWRAECTVSQGFLQHRHDAFQTLPRPHGKATFFTWPRPPSLSLMLHDDVLDLVYWRTDVSVFSNSFVVRHGDGHRVRDDNLKRAIWPTHLYDPNESRANWQIIHPDIGFIQMKGPRSLRDKLPDIFFRLKDVWIAASNTVACGSACHFCGGADADLITCCVCLLTVHRSCEPCKRPGPDLTMDPNLLPSAFVGKLCSGCSRACGQEPLPH